MLKSPIQLQEHLGIKRHHIAELIKQGMPCLKISERVTRFDLEKVLKWIEEKQ